MTFSFLKKSFFIICCSGLFVLHEPAEILAQGSGSVAGRGEVFVGTEIEYYLRYLQIVGVSPSYPWTVRSFSPKEVDHVVPQDSVHPWEAHSALNPAHGPGLQVALVRPELRLIYNSAFPHGSNNGVVWAGRGLTTSVQAGFSANYGPASLTVAPVFFRAQNRPFELLTTGRDGRLAFADGGYTDQIDLPQRFGDQAYTRVDPGATTLRVDFPVVAMGASTANQHWGPAREYPIVLGNNAPGFPHAFLGSSAPLNVGIGRVHGRFVWGRLSQSAYSPVGVDSASRFMSGLAGVFVPRGLPGMELGAGRFFHSHWPAQGLKARHFLRPLEGLLKSGLRAGDLYSRDEENEDLRRSDSDNQLAAVFLRWVFPESGLEVYGEYGKEDHNWNLRDLLLQPEHHGAYMLGVQKVWRRSPVNFLALRGEALNSQVTHAARVRSQVPFYVHGWLRQGHTHRGQLLGSPAGFGGAGSVVALDSYHPHGRWTLAWSRMIRQEATGWRQKLFFRDENRDPYGLDTIHTFGAETLLFLGRFEVGAGLTGAYNLNRNFTSNVFNFNGALTTRARF